ncbi:hypothetical protein SpCBS45565_g05105 [Spizellomyces sp. 'palustris']|nr:hypothetical protein SpCBS45565_g05105 [Spizellomyces sp. 'palustris']
MEGTDPSSLIHRSRSPHKSRLSLCKTFHLLYTEYSVPLSDGSGHLPMDRRCLQSVFMDGKGSRGAVLLIPGFASNRHMFHLGGGLGKTGPSFAEFLAKRSFDVFSVDLRGTSESLKLGSTRPASMKEYVEVDIPSAISVVKKVGNYDKVYLIGHSMGGALSCAVAGLHPNDVAGVVHLAGLYHYTIPGLSEIIELYKAFCPSPVKAILSGTTHLATRSVSAVLSPVVSGILYLTGANTPPDDSDQAGCPPAHDVNHPPPRLDSDPDLTTDAPPNTSTDLIIPKAPLPPSSKHHLLTYMRQFLTHIKRQPIPLRSALNAVLFLRQFVPSRIENAIMNAVYPSPWVPNSVEDPWGLMDTSVESPSIGVYLSITQMAIHHEYYNNWVMSSSNHRTDVVTEDLQHVSQAAEPPVVSASPSTPSKKRSKSQLHVHFAPPPIPPSPTTIQYPAPPTPHWSTWNELSPYLSNFELLEHLPLFFCYANADGVIRVKDTMAGYQRSGSKWKDVIRYEEDEIAKERRREIYEGIRKNVDQVFETLADGHARIQSPSKTVRFLPTTTIPTHYTLPRPAKSYSSSNLQTLKTPPPPNHLRHYAIEPGYSYGHVDILAGVHAEIMWEKIAMWLAVTAERDREWRTWRRYSAK